MGSCCFKAPGGNSTNKVHVGKNQVQPITDQPSAHSHHDDWDYKNCGLFEFFNKLIKLNRI